MESIRSVMVALAAVTFVACTNTETNAPNELATEPEQAQAGTTRKKDAPADLQESEDGAESSSDDPLTGLPQSAPPSSPAPSPSTSPPCGKNLTCSATSVGGSKACRQQAASTADVYCCPNPFDRIVDGVCVPKICPSGLTCAASPTTGATACRQTASSTSDVFCCPTSGWRIQNGQCIPPLCGSGLTCSGSPTVGAPACRQYTSSTTNIYCCAQPGAQIVNGRCQ